MRPDRPEPGSVRFFLDLNACCPYGNFVMDDRFPSHVTLVEVGPRDGFQFEKTILPTPLKLEIICGLLMAGLTHVQVTSFVHPRKVPQMADAEALLKRLPRNPGISYSGLVLNLKGVERARQARLDCVEISLSVSDTHSRKNAGISLQDGVRQAREMIRFAADGGMRIVLSLQCAFGCAYEGEIPPNRVYQIGQSLLDHAPSGAIIRFSLADTTGMAHPHLIAKLLKKFDPVMKALPVGLHLHDTRGLGLVNLMTALECGVRHFDTALAGMGGCPFVPDAAGNIPTEDTAYMLEKLGIETGVNIARVAKCSRRLAKYFDKRFPGKLYRLEEDEKACAKPL